jgi:plasmid stabilization system protein ParE
LEKLAEDLSAEAYDGLWDAVDTLEKFPERCAFAPEPSLRERGVRQLLYDVGRHAYRVLYRVRDERVVILTIRHSSRRPLRGI